MGNRSAVRYQKANWLKDHVPGPTLRSMSAQDEGTGDLIIDRGQGVHITDIDGTQMIDCVGGLWCVNAGYGREEVITATENQLRQLSYTAIFPGSAPPRRSNWQAVEALPRADLVQCLWWPAATIRPASARAPSGLAAQPH